MNVDVYYAGKRTSTKFLVVPAGTNISDMKFPKGDQDLDHREFNILQVFKRDVPSDLIGATQGDVADQIQMKGYAICNITEPDTTAN